MILMATYDPLLIPDGEGGELTIYPSSFSDLKGHVRKLVFLLARKGDPTVVKWLWDNFKLRELTYEEISAINERRRRESRLK